MMLNFNIVLIQYSLLPFFEFLKSRWRTNRKKVSSSRQDGNLRENSSVSRNNLRMWVSGSPVPKFHAVIFNLKCCCCCSLKITCQCFSEQNYTLFSSVIMLLFSALHKNCRSKQSLSFHKLSRLVLLREHNILFILHAFYIYTTLLMTRWVSSISITLYYL